MAALLVPLAGQLLPVDAGATTYSICKEWQFLDSLNALRTSKGRRPLVMATGAVQTARAHSDRQAAAGNIFHSNLNTSATLAFGGSNWIKVGENVGRGGTTSSIHSALVASPEHYANLVDNDFTYVGIGVVDTPGGMFVTQLFGKVRSGVAAYPRPACGQVAGPRVGFVNTAGALRINEGPLNAAWTTVAASGVKSFDLDGSRIAALMTNGDLLVKEGPLNATWTKVANGVTGADLEGNRIAVRWNSGGISVKEGPLNATWTAVTSGASVKLEGNRIAVRSAAGGLSVKEGPLNATWTTVASSGVAGYDLSD